MDIGIPTEVKPQEYRVGASPSLVHALVQKGHKVSIQAGAGKKIGFTDDKYDEAGAQIVATSEEVYKAELILKVKEPQPREYPLLRQGQILFGFLHLAADREQLKHLIERKVIAIATETVTDASGRLPILTPMSEVAGKLAIHAGGTALQILHGGKGLLLGGVPGTSCAKVVILGGGIVGEQAARVAIGEGADVTILDNQAARLRELDTRFGPKLKTLFASPQTIEEAVIHADLVIGAVLIPGKKTPRLVTEETVRRMSPGSAIVDVSIDQGGCIETARPTTHQNPTYIMHQIVHYCVANMPSACALTSTIALSNAVSPYIMEIADKGCTRALKDNPGLKDGLNVYFGHVTNPQVASIGYTFVSPDELLSTYTKKL